MKATAHPQDENDRIIVTEWRFAPGAETGFHVHAHDYVVVPLVTGVLRIEDLDPGGVRAHDANRDVVRTRLCVLKLLGQVRRVVPGPKVQTLIVEDGKAGERDGLEDRTDDAANRRRGDRGARGVRGAPGVLSGQGIETE